jgi:uncharacterized protein
MTTRVIHLAKDLAIPLEAVSRTFGILAVRGAGKSNTAAVMAEEMFAAGLPFVVVDPVGSWFGLRSSADGTQPGLPIPIFGGKHGDVPLERGAGELLADLVVEKRLTCVLDLSRFDSEAAKKAFLLAFAQRLYLKNENPLHLFLEEADDYIPQKPMRDEAQLLRAWENIVRRGRARGLGMTLITQRSAAVNKMVLTQVETLFAMRTTGPQDIAAIEAWVKYHQAGQEVLSTLASLEDGEAWVWSPHFLKTMSRHQIRRRLTFDSGATPANIRAKDTRPPATLADIDLSALQERMVATIEKAKADDPRELRKQIGELRRELEAAKHLKVPDKDRPKPTSVEVLTDADRALLGDLVASLRSVAEDFFTGGGARSVAVLQQKAENAVVSALTTLRSDLSEIVLKRHEQMAKRLETAGFQKILGKLANVQPPPSRQLGVMKAEPPRRSSAATRQTETRVPRMTNGSGLAGELGRVHRAFLTVLANRQGKSTRRNQLAVFSGYSAKSRHVDNTISALRSAGYLQGSSDALAITAAGLAALGAWDELPTGRELIDYWIREAGTAPGAMLRALVEAYPKTLSRDEVAEASNYSPTSRHVDNSLSYLRTLELIEGDRSALSASQELFG